MYDYNTDTGYFTADQSCIKVTLYKSYLNTLEAGKHTLTVEFGGEYEGMKYETEFTVNAVAAASAGKQAPATGDNSGLGLWLGMASVSILAMGAILTLKRKEN